MSAQDAARKLRVPVSYVLRIRSRGPVDGRPVPLIDSKTRYRLTPDAENKVRAYAARLANGAKA